MNKTIKLLWVEDQARQGALLNCTLNLERDKTFDLTIIPNASTAEEQIMSHRFEKIVFDIRILPGNNAFWEKEHNALNLRLGIKLIERVIGKIKQDKTAYGIISIEDWQNLRNFIMTIDPFFNESNQFRRKNYFVYANRIIPFITNLK